MKKKERNQYIKNRIWNSHFNSEQLFCLTIYLLILFISKHFCDKDAAHTHVQGMACHRDTLPANISVACSSLIVYCSWEIHCRPD